MVALAMSIRETNQLLKRWGFVLEGGSGGHAIWLRGDRRVQLPFEGRHAPVTRVMVKKAADICGVTVSEFLVGPPRPKVPAIDLREAPMHSSSDNGQNGQKPHDTEPEPNVTIDLTEIDDDPGETEEQRSASPSDRLLNYLRARANQEFNLADLCERLALRTPNAISALKTLMKNHPEVQRVQRGKYVYLTALSAPTPEEKHEQRLREMRTFEKVHVDPHGRVYLQDHNGEMWVAIKVEPSFYPMTMTEGEHL